MPEHDRREFHPDPTGVPRIAVLDGNAVAGRLSGLLGEDPTLVRLRCGHCGAVAVLAEVVAELDDTAAILRCRTCTRTLLTVLERPAGSELVVAALASVQYDHGD